MTPSDLSPHLYFFGHAVDAGTELDLLADFAVRIQALLDDAASKASHDVRPMSDTELIFAEDLSHVYSEIHGTMFHEAFLISAVIFVERTLAIYTDGLQQAMGIGLALKDIAGSGLERFRTYCTKLAQIDPAPDCWEDMKGLIEIRNCVVHNSGSLSGFNRSGSVEAFVRRNGFPQIDGPQIKVSSESSQVFLRVIKRFIDSIFSEALQRFPDTDAGQLPHNK